MTSSKLIFIRHKKSINSGHYVAYSFIRYKNERLQSFFAKNKTMIDHQDTDLPLSVRDEAFCQILRLMCGLLREPVLTRAAESLGITTPTASRRLARAREWFGDELFIYSAGRMVPTRRMIELEPVCRRMIENLDELFTSPHPFDPHKAEGVIRIVAVDNAFLTLLSPLIVELEVTVPGVKFEIYDRYSNMLESMRDAKIDLAIYSTEGKAVPAGFIEMPLFTSDHVLLVRRNHPLKAIAAHNGGLTFEDTARFKHIGIALAMGATENRFIIGQQCNLADKISCEMPYFVAGACLCSESDLLMRMPRETALKLARYFPVEILRQERGLKLPWRPGLFWYRSSDTPLLTWVRSKITIGAKRIFEEAEELLPFDR